VSDQDDRQAEVTRQFEAILAGAGLDELRGMLAELTELGTTTRRPSRPARPELRRARLAEPFVFRLRVDLHGARPPIWRRLEVRSDMSLLTVHRVLQAAFGWMDSHLWRFSLGGDPFDHGSQLFLCEWDVEEGEHEDEGAIAAKLVRLDETLQDPGDLLYYVYDYGDNWELRVVLEERRQASASDPYAVATAGRRASPPEDCGGLTDGEALAEVLEDPAAFDLEVINDELCSPSLALDASGFDGRLVDLIHRLEFTSVSDDLKHRAAVLLEDPGPPEDLHRSLAAILWFLNRAKDEGIPLTAAGYMKPADVRSAAAVIPTVEDWIGKVNRENDTTPVLHLRKAIQSLGLLRKAKDKLVLTRAGALAQEVPEELWNHLADRLVPKGDGFDTDATILSLAYAATSADHGLALDDVATALYELGWRTGTREPLDRYDLIWLPALEIIRNVTSERHVLSRRWTVSPAAAVLACAALKRR